MGVPSSNSRVRALVVGSASSRSAGAYARWADPANEQGFAKLAHEALNDLQAAGAAL